MQIYKYTLKKKFIKILYNLLLNKGLFLIIKILNLNILKERIFFFLKEKNSFFFKFKIQRVKLFFPKDIQKILVSNLFFLYFFSLNSFFEFFLCFQKEFKDVFLIYLFYYEKRYFSFFYIKNLLSKENILFNSLENIFLILNNFKIHLYFKIINILILNNLKKFNLILNNGNNKSSK